MKESIPGGTKGKETKCHRGRPKKVVPKQFLKNINLETKDGSGCGDDSGGGGSGGRSIAGGGGGGRGGNQIVDNNNEAVSLLMEEEEPVAAAAVVADDEEKVLPDSRKNGINALAK